MKLGITLPNFRDDPEPALAVARAAETAGLDGVFGFDHLFRRAHDGALRPALEGLTLLGAVAAETTRIAFGPLVGARVAAPGGHARRRVGHARPDSSRSVGRDDRRR